MVLQIGNFLITKDEPPKICMLDFGQCKELDHKYRLEIAKFVALYNRAGVTDEEIVRYMRSVGFKTKNDKPATYAFYAKFACDSKYIPNPMQQWIKVMEGTFTSTDTHMCIIQ
jgi:predicted unusual protein kinase regulating ubiquinone biosynthesis (AarF/ABC1/UbiB family)